MNHIELSLKIEPFHPFNEIFVAKLSEIGFESFVEVPPFLKAYIIKSSLDQDSLERILNDYSKEISLTKEFIEIPKENWNKKWEESFKPIEIGTFCRIRAPFHKSDSRFENEIVIEPKMSFGTGHHETTQLMIELMQTIKFDKKYVLDMGSGTGILAILCQKLGSRNITAIDIEDWAYENMIENFQRNNCSEIIKAVKGGVEKIEPLDSSDIILANINKNVLKSQFDAFSKNQNNKGQLLISGFFETDLEELSDLLESLNYQRVNHRVRNSWTAAVFEKD